MRTHQPLNSLPLARYSHESRSMAERSSSRGIAGPDFFGIGAQKAGTGWLYDQLRQHPDFWMPPMKELHYFDRLASPNQALNRRSLPLARQETDRIQIARQRARDDHDEQFLNQFEALCGQDSLDFDAYARLFAAKGDRIAGDITPGYSTLDPPVIEQIVGRFANAKFIFIARDPVERAWSQLSMYVRRGLIDLFDANDAAAISRHLNRPEIRSRSFPSEIVRQWRQIVRPDQFGIFLFDELKRDARAFRSRVISFLGGDPDKSSGELPADHNAKAEKRKLTLSAAAREHLAKFFKDELQACAVELGGPASDWPKRYGF